MKENEEEIQENSVVVNGEVAYEHYKHVVEDKQVTMRIDKFVSNQIANMTRTKTQKLADQGFVFVNDEPVKSSYKIKPKDVIRIVKDVPKRDNTLVAQDIPVNIVFEDDYFVIVNKAPGMVVHPSYGHYTGTLVNGLLFKYSDISKTGNSERPGLVHRIDKNTSGLLVVARNADALTHLGRQFFNHTIKRKYIALVWGDFNEESGIIEGYIGRNLKNRKVMDVFQDESKGKKAITHFKVVERFQYVTLVECELETGRTHQIRVHMKSIGHTLFNDQEYGGDKILKGTRFTKYKQFVQNCFKIFPRQALHAKSLGFIHPKTEKAMFFSSDLPKNFQDLIEKWRNYFSSNLSTD